MKTRTAWELVQQDALRLQAMIDHPLRTLAHIREHLHDRTRYSKEYHAFSIEVITHSMKLVRKSTRAKSNLEV